MLLLRLQLPVLLLLHLGLLLLLRRLLLGRSTLG